MSRYNGIVVALSNILLWWDSMGTVDKASPVNIDLLVQMGEATLNAVSFVCLFLPSTPSPPPLPPPSLGR